jgi:tetratricopeptide (TPR) repeat protein
VALPADHPVALLASLEVTFLGGNPVAEPALKLAAGQAGYGAAWAFAAIAAETEGSLAEAARAARRAAELLPGKGWDSIAARLDKTVTARSLQDATAKLRSGDSAGALVVATELLTADPSLTAAREVAARAYLALGNVAGAASMIPALPDSPDGLELKGQVAERLGQWDLAVQFYKRLPVSHPRRCQLLGSALQQWRLVNAPPHVTKALASQRLTRRGLAALLVWKLPTLAEAAAGSVPVFDDVVNLPERSDLIIAARTGLMPGDALTRRFGAERPVSPGELKAVLGRLAKLVGRSEPTWCVEGSSEDCLMLPDVVTGEVAAGLVDEVAGLEEEPCRS